jgi:glycosyltransferase involved in cell wall biosynthesis
LEALRAGKPVIATDRGCISDEVPTAAGSVFPESEFIDASVPQLLEWANDPAKLAAASLVARTSAQDRFHAARNSLRDILAEISMAPDTATSDHIGRRTIHSHHIADDRQSGLDRL